MCVFVLVGLPAPAVNRAIPWLPQPRKGKGIAPLSASRPYPVGRPLGEGGQGAGGTGQQQGAEAGAGTRAGQAAAPIPRCSRAPCRSCRPGGWGWKRELVFPGAQGRYGPAWRPRKGEGQHVVAGRARDPPCEQDPGSLTAPSPCAPFPGPKSSSRRLSQASAGLARTLPPAAPEAPTPLAPRARLGCAHGRLTLCRRRSCCRPDRRRYRSPPFAVSAPKGTRVNEEGPRNITPPALPPGLSAAPPDRKSHARTHMRAHVRRAAPGLARSAAHVVRRCVCPAPGLVARPIVC